MPVKARGSVIMTHRVHVYRSLEELMLQFFGAWQLLGRDDLAH